MIRTIRPAHTITAGVAALALAFGATTVASAGGDTEAAQAKKKTSLAQVLAADGASFDEDWGDFDILDAAVTAVLEAKPDSAVKILAKPKKKLTAFIPTDRAFRNLAGKLGAEKPATEADTFTALAETVGVDVIETVLLYHVVPGTKLPAKKVLKSDGAKLTTAAGKRVSVKVSKKGVVRIVDADPDLANPKVIATDVNKGNPQIAHVINRVLLPINI